MRYSLVDGERREAEKGLLGKCIGCERPMIPKCGPFKVRHWAHKSQCECDHWWEPETEWHRKWKGLFPPEWQEIRHKADNGEWHIADVKTAQGWILEFQNSPITAEERDARVAFYRRIVWIVNGNRFKRDSDQFFKSVEEGIKICLNPQVIKVFSSEASIFRKWSSCRVPVFFDFGEDYPLWCLHPAKIDHWCFVAPIGREKFLECHRGGDEQEQRFVGLLQVFNRVMTNYALQIQQHRQVNLLELALANRSRTFQRYRRSFRNRRRF